MDLRETEDMLTRDMLASTASSINCTHGTNGKMLAVLKSSLIDLELSHGDNRAEGVSHGERLSEKNHSNMIYDSLITLATA